MDKLKLDLIRTKKKGFWIRFVKIIDIKKRMEYLLSKEKKNFL